MRIALFTETYLPHINGVVTHVKILRDGLLQQGHEVLVVTADYQTRHHYIKDGILHCPAIKSKRFYGYGVASPFSRRRLKLVQDFHPDIIHIHQRIRHWPFGHFCWPSSCMFRWFIRCTRCMTTIYIMWRPAICCGLQKGQPRLFPAAGQQPLRN